MKWLGKHSGGGESGKRVGIERGGENVGELAGHKGLQETMGVYRSRDWVGHGRGSSRNRCVQHGGCGCRITTQIWGRGG